MVTPSRCATSRAVSRKAAAARIRFGSVAARAVSDGQPPETTTVRPLIRHQDRFLLVLDLDRVFSALLNDPSIEAP